MSYDYFYTGAFVPGFFIAWIIDHENLSAVESSMSEHHAIVGLHTGYIGLNH